MMPTGKKAALMLLIRPGALVRNHGEALVDSARAHPNPRSGPPRNELRNILSIRIRAFAAPIRETSSVVCAGVKASIFCDSDWNEKYIRGGETDL